MNALVKYRRHAVAKKVAVAEPLPPSIPADVAKEMQAIAAVSLASNTKTAYASDWAEWSKWAAETGNSDMPAHPSAVAAFLTVQGRQWKYATISRRLATICARHTRKGVPFDKRAKDIRAVMDGLRKKLGTTQKQAKPLTAGLLKAFTFEDSLIGRRDRALLMLGVATGLRRSELVALDWLVRGEGDDVIAEHPEGLLITLYAAKTGHGDAQVVPLKNRAVIAAVKAWVKAAAIADGEALFRSINRHGQVRDRLTGHAVGVIVKSRCTAAGIDAEFVSGHSLRAGMITSAANAKVDRLTIKRASRHSSSIVDSYIRNATVWDGDVSDSLDFGDDSH